jgi:hypothetical protein
LKVARLSKMKFFNVALLFAGVALAAPNPAPVSEVLVGDSPWGG